MLDGLQYLHWRGVAHLDLQPDNIVLTTCRRVDVKLVDFGSAQKVTKLGALVHRTCPLEFSGELRARLRCCSSLTRHTDRIHCVTAVT